MNPKVLFTQGTESHKPVNKLVIVIRHLQSSAKISFPDLQLQLVIKVAAVFVMFTYTTRSRKTTASPTNRKKKQPLKFG